MPNTAQPKYPPDPMHLLLRLESMAIFALTLVLYAFFAGPWWLFLALFFLPDLSILFYQVGKRQGAIAYNLCHIEVFPAILAIVAYLFSLPITLSIAVIWFSHIAFDRMLGIGLKRFEGFTSTHLGRLPMKR